MLRSRGLYLFSLECKRLAGRSVAICRATTSSAGFDDKQKVIEDNLRKRFPDAKHLEVEDISGGCGSMYRVHVTDEEFRGKMKVQQHRMVTEVLRAQIKEMHGITIETKPP